jgi:pimeloyl-ACP methyl ester carboxylesterase
VEILVVELIGLVFLVAVATVSGFMVSRRRLIRELEAESTVIQTTHGQIEYVDIGRGPPVLFIHGTPGGFDEPLNYIKATRSGQFQYRYIIPSRPGYLRTPLEVGKSPLEQAAVFAELLTLLGVDRVSLIASSGGGPCALQFAINYPSRCSALILEEAVSQTMCSSPAPLKPSKNRDYLVWLLGGIKVRQWQSADPSDPVISAIGWGVVRSINLSDRRGRGEANDYFQFARLEDLPLHRIICPTLILHGTADKNLPISHSERAHEQIVGSELYRFVGADHFMLITRYKEIQRVEGAFLAKHAVT